MIEVKNKKRIIDYLREEEPIANLNLIGAIENIDGTLFDNASDAVAILVDNLEEPTGVIVREHEYWHYVYHKEEAFLETAYNDYFSTLGEYGFDATDMTVYEFFKSKGELEWDEPCYLYYVNPSDYIHHESTLFIDEVTLSDAEEIDDLYTFKDEYSRVFIEDNIKNRPTCCYREEGVLAAWVLMHRDNSMGIMYTKKEFRKRNLAYELSTALIDKVIEKGQIPYIHIGIENEASQKLASKCGFIRYKPVMWFGMKGASNDQSNDD